MPASRRSVALVLTFAAVCAAVGIGGVPGTPERGAMAYAAEPESPPASAGDPTGAEAPATAEGLTLFESKIRPILVEHCYECHAADSKKLQGGLVLDTRAGLRQGGDSGPAVVPGNPDDSLLLSALKYESFEMPPKGPLPARVIADFEAWIRLGAPDPREGKSVARQGLDIEAGRKHWAFQPPRAVQPPPVKQADWPRGPIDQFVLARLEQAGLAPVADADRATWLRRVYFDLIGLPPSPEELDAFVADRAPGAAERVVDRLLASRHFGERWGRHWLDVARFAESSGGGRSMVFPEAWRYRDYVIEAFNADLPLDQFLTEQLAGDLLPTDDRAVRERRLVATGYLMLGAINYEEQDKRQLEMDVVDEQLEAVGKGMLGMTLGCARCHDHKFDPIPTRDYYALAGIFRSTSLLRHDNVSKWIERELPTSADARAAIEQHAARVAALKAELAEARRRLAEVVRAERGPTAAPIEVAMLEGIVLDDTAARRVGEWTDSTLYKTYVGNGYVHDANSDKGTKTLTFAPEFPAAGLYEVRLAYTPGDNRAPRVPVEILHLDGEFSGQIDETVEPPIEGRFVSLGQFRFDESNQWFVMVSNEGTDGYVVVDCVQFLPVDENATADSPAAVAAPPQAAPVAKAAAGSPSAPGAANGADEKATVARLEAEMKRLEAEAPRVPQAMAVADDEKMVDCAVCIRGNPHQLGPVVPRGFLQVATLGDAPRIPADASGRRELAAWLTDPQHPLTARVFVNRAWHWLFGVGLVRTVDNFGTTGEAPSHPELLDYLATDFVAHGWSVKRLVRQLVLSRTYQLSSEPEPRALAADPEARLRWRMARRRLDAESIRDAMLAQSGQLDLSYLGSTISDPAVLKAMKADMPTEYTFEFTDTRRSVYTPAFRNRVHELFEVFDFADQNTVAGQRNVSTVAPQALYLLNSPWVIEQAQAAARRMLGREELTDDEARVERAFREALGRLPTAGERRVALAAVAGPPQGDPAAREAAWARLFQALWGSVDFRYLN